jgi:hypothetical protein
MRRSILAFVMAFIIFQSCNGPVKSSSKEIINNEFKWKIQIPEGFESVTADQWAKLQNRGQEAIEKTYDTKIQNQAKTIFVFRADQLNYFESNSQPFDSAIDGDYLQTYNDVNRMLYGTFEAQMPAAKLDSASSIESIDGKEFRSYRVTINVPDKLLMELLTYSRLFGNKEFTVNIMTADKKKQKILVDAWRSSKFGH